MYGGVCLEKLHFYPTRVVGRKHGVEIMKTYLSTGLCAAFFASFIVVAMQRAAEAGAVVPNSDGSSGEQQAEALPGLPNYAAPEDEEEVRRRMRRQQQPSPAPGQAGAGAYAQPQMPLPPTYTPGSPASYGQPSSAARLPMAPTSYGTYNSPMAPGGGSGFGLPGPGQQMPGQMGSMGMQPGGLGMPPSPTAPAPMATSPGTAGEQQSYGPHSPSGVRQAATPQAPATAHRQQAAMPSGAKPFQNYKRKSPYSPYMSLFRDQDSARGVNNYYNLVKPALEQGQQNRQFRGQINGLQSASSYQNQSIQQINQQNQARQRPGSVIPGANVQPRMPATFMNMQQYYPGMR